MEEVKKAAPRKRAVKKKPVEAAEPKKLVWKWLSDTQELVQVEVAG